MRITKTSWIRRRRRRGRGGGRQCKLLAKLDLDNLGGTTDDDDALVDGHGEDADDISEHDVVEEADVSRGDVPEADHRDVLGASDRADQDVIPNLHVVETPSRFRLPLHALLIDVPRPDVAVVSARDHHSLADHQQGLDLPFVGRQFEQDRLRRGGGRGWFGGSIEDRGDVKDVDVVHGVKGKVGDAREFGGRHELDVPDPSLDAQIDGQQRGGDGVLVQAEDGETAVLQARDEQMGGERDVQRPHRGDASDQLHCDERIAAEIDGLDGAVCRAGVAEGISDDHPPDLDGVHLAALKGFGKLELLGTMMGIRSKIRRRRRRRRWESRR